MVEQPQVGVCENDVVLIRRLDALLVHDASAGCSKVLDAATERPVDVVGEGEERVARARDAAELLRVRGLLLGRKRLRHALEQALPLCALAALEDLSADEQVDRVRLLRALHALLER